MKRVNLKGMYISTSSSTAVAIPAHDGWIPVGNEDRGRGGFEVRAISGGGTTTISLGIETATDVRNPDSTPTSIVTSRNANGVQDPDTTPTSLTMGGKQVYRYVWMISSSAGAGGGWVTGFGETWKS